MESLDIGKKTFLKFSNLDKAGVFHFTSTRHGWNGDGNARFTGDIPELYQPYRKELSESFQLHLEQFVFPRQVHGNNVVIVDSPIDAEDIPGTDALITNQSGLCICVQTADCVPILLYDPVKRVAATIHAGWRGTVARIVSETVVILKDRFHVDPKNILAGIGPSASPEVYEVGDAVISEVNDKLMEYNSLLKYLSGKGKAYFDLWEANKLLLLNCGLIEQNIEIMGQCSIQNSMFYSARREGVDTGRMVTGIMIQ